MIRSNAVQSGRVQSGPDLVQSSSGLWSGRPLPAHLHAEAGVAAADAPARRDHLLWGAQLLRVAQVAAHVVLWNQTQPVSANSPASSTGDRWSASAVLTDVVAQPHPHGPKPLQLVPGSSHNVPHDDLDVVNPVLLQLKHTRRTEPSQVCDSKLQLHPQWASVSWSAVSKLSQSALSLLRTVEVFCQSVLDCV